jgi:hypothetical protein
VVVVRPFVSHGGHLFLPGAASPFFCRDTLSVFINLEIPLKLARVSVSNHFWHQCNVFRCVTRLITSLCQQCSGYLLYFTYSLTHFTVILSCGITPITLCGGCLPSLSSMPPRLRLLSVFWYSNILLVSSAYIGVLWTGYWTQFAKFLSHVRQSVASEKSRLIHCYDLSLWELNNFHCSCFHGSILLNMLQYKWIQNPKFLQLQQLSWYIKIWILLVKLKFINQIGLCSLSYYFSWWGPNVCHLSFLRRRFFDVILLLFVAHCVQLHLFFCCVLSMLFHHLLGVNSLIS